MEERPLNFNINDDQTMVEVDQEKMSGINKSLQMLNMCTGQLSSTLKDNTLSEGFRDTLLTGIENATVELLNYLNYESDLAKRKAERSLEIRSLNEQNRELRRQLGDKVSNEDAREKLKNLAKVVESWWNEEGFGLTSELLFVSSGYLKIKFAAGITPNWQSKDRSSSEKERMAMFQEKGFLFNEDERHPIDNDHNRELLTKLIVGRFPSAQIYGITNYNGRRQNDFTMRDIEVYIYNLDDLNEPTL